MTSRPALKIAVLLVALVLFVCVALIEFESVNIAKHLVYFQRQELTVSAARPVASKLRAVEVAKTTGRLTSDNEMAVAIEASELHGVDKSTKMHKQSRVTDLDELMTPEWIEKIETQRIDPLTPVQVHLLWIGDINKAPNDRQMYSEKGYQLTVHSNPEEILEGFHPYVLKAYRQAIPTVVGYDFLKFALLYKHGGFAVDADTSPAVPASEIKFPSGCDVIFSKEAIASNWVTPTYRDKGGPTYGLNRPFQILNWAMAASKPRNKHIKYMLRSAMMHFFGLRDMEGDLIQDISGSGLMTDYVALLHEQKGYAYRDVFIDRSKYIPLEGLCLTQDHLRGKWIHHSFLGSWKQPGAQ